MPTPIPHTYEEEDLLKHLLTEQTVVQGLWSFQLILKNKEKSNQHFMLTALNPEYTQALGKLGSGSTPDSIKASQMIDPCSMGHQLPSCQQQVHGS